MLRYTLYVFSDKQKNRKLANIRPSSQFYGMIILVKTKSLCIGMAWLAFQKLKSEESTKISYCTFVYITLCCIQNECIIKAQLSLNVYPFAKEYYSREREPTNLLLNVFIWNMSGIPMIFLLLVCCMGSIL